MTRLKLRQLIWTTIIIFTRESLNAFVEPKVRKLTGIFHFVKTLQRQMPILRDRSTPEYTWLSVYRIIIFLRRTTTNGDEENAKFIVTGKVFVNNQKGHRNPIQKGLMRINIIFRKLFPTNPLIRRFCRLEMFHLLTLMLLFDCRVSIVFNVFAITNIRYRASSR